MPTLHQHLPANTVGRDFIVGDLHGCLDLLQAELTRIDFSPAADRLFSVGDLADRGPDSMGCLRLLREPWFFAVRGNHEDMLIDYCLEVVPPYGSSACIQTFFRNGGGWVRTLDSDTQVELRQDMLPRVMNLPYVITVGEGASMFHVAHAELMTGSIDQGGFWSKLEGLPEDRSKKQVLNDDQLTEKVLAKMIEPLTWGRRLVGQVDEDKSTKVDTPAGMLLVSQQPMHSGLSLTYVGHTPLTNMILHESHLFIDRGAYVRGSNTCLLVLYHHEVCEWLA